jgi:UPF0716 protein FxsA
MWKLVLLFILVPVTELALFIEIGSRIGTVATLGLIGLTGVLGAFLARRQGLGAFQRMRDDAALGRLPAEPSVEGVIVLLAGALLLTPGFLTDASGFLLLFPAFRRAVKGLVWRRLLRAVHDGSVQASVWYDVRLGSSSADDMDEVHEAADSPVSRRLQEKPSSTFGSDADTERRTN